MAEERQRKDGFVVVRREQSFFQTEIDSALSKKEAEKQRLDKKNPDDWELILVQALIIL